MKFFATYDTEEEAARACDVVTFYTNRASSHYNFPDSVTFIELTCKRRPQEYDELSVQDPVQYTRLIRSFMLSQAENLLRNLFPAKPANKRTRRLPNDDNGGVPKTGCATTFQVGTQVLKNKHYWLCERSAKLL